MKQLIISAILAILLFSPLPVHSQTPLDRKMGFGIILGDPMGFTFKTVWSKQTDASGSIGSSYFGA